MEQFNKWLSLHIMTSHIGDPDVMDAADSSSSEVSRVAVRLPPFWPERPAVWFAQAEAQFTTYASTE
jgi:hypothetical protein